MIRILSLALVIAMCLPLVQCASSPVSARELTEAEQALVESDNAFGFKLFKSIVGDEEDKNVFISPLSVSMSLGMTLNGAAGDTREAMEQALELSGLTEQEINESYQSLIELLAGLDPQVKFQIANSIWYRQEQTLEEVFVTLNRDYFDAEVSGLDFSDPDTADVINAWVDQKTNGKIEEIVDQEDVLNTVLFLINAIYFKGTWTYEFNPESTYQAQFTLPDGSQKPCQMMSQKNDFQYLATSEFQAIDLPYGDGDFSMTILLPNAGYDIDSLITQLDPDTWEEWTGSFSESEVSLDLPKFTLEYELLLNEALQSMGMEIAFTPEADFSRMLGSGGLWIDKVKHKTFVEVNEEGTEAAAVTSTGMTLGMGTQMRVDRPFLFAIRDHHSGTVLFIGKIVEPTLS